MDIRMARHRVRNRILRRASRLNLKVLRRLEKSISLRLQPIAMKRSAAAIKATAWAAARTHLVETAATPKVWRRKRD
jgi:hypothetical protein